MSCSLEWIQVFRGPTHPVRSPHGLERTYSMKRTLARFAFACTLALTAAGASRADTIYWYNWVRNPVSLPTVQQNHPNLAGTGGINLLDLNSSAVQAEND